jgi:hypothetical protein
MPSVVLCLVVRDNYSAVVGWAEWSLPEEYSRQDRSRMTAYDTDRRRLFSRQGERHAVRRAKELGLRLVVGDYFGLDESRPDGESAAAYARRRFAHLLPAAVVHHP